MAQFIAWRQQGRKVTKFWFRRRAKMIWDILYADQTDDNGNKSIFKFSNGWFRRFCQRWDISFRRLTHQAQKLPSEYALLVNNFLRFIRRNSVLQGNFGSYWRFRLSNILNMDEVPISFEFFEGYSYHLKGERTISGSTGNSSWSKRQATLVLYIFADGVPRLKPKLIFHGTPGGPIERAEKDLYDKRVSIEFNETAYNNEDLFTKWLDDELLNPDVLGGRDSLLVMDHAAFHKTPDVLQKLKGTNVVPALIPPGCTSLLQPLDVAINKPFKEWLRRALDEVLDNDDLEDSSRSAISRRRIAVTKAIGIAFDELTRRAEMVQNSFIHTGIAIPPNGSEDHRINMKDHPNVDFSDWEKFPSADDSIDKWSSKRNLSGQTKTLRRTTTNWFMTWMP